MASSAVSLLARDTTVTREALRHPSRGEQLRDSQHLVRLISGTDRRGSELAHLRRLPVDRHRRDLARTPL
jgi:hypothetical protein